MTIEEMILEELKRIHEKLDGLPCGDRHVAFTKLEARVDNIYSWIKGIVTIVSGIIIYILSRVFHSLFGGN